MQKEMLLSLPHSHVVPNQYDLLSSMKNKEFSWRMSKLLSTLQWKLMVINMVVSGPLSLKNIVIMCLINHYLWYFF